MAELSFSQVDALLKYEPETGKLFWKERPVEMFPSQRTCNIWNTRYAGKEAFTSLNNAGYKHGSLVGRSVLAHRVAWLLTNQKWPDGEVDHINGKRDDNREENLRDVTNLVNRRNQKRPKNNTSGTIGVTWFAKIGKWNAQIRVNRKNIYLGDFSEKIDAIKARKEGEVRFGFHPNHGRTA